MTSYDVGRDFKRTPYLADLMPGGKYLAKDMWEAGGVPMLMRTLLDGGFLHGDCLTVTGKTVAENLKDVKFNDRPACDLSLSTNRSRRPAAWWGSRAISRPEGAIVKVAGMKT